VATNEPDYILPLTAPVHAIDNEHGSFRRGEFSLEDKGAFAVASRGFGMGDFGSDSPVAVLFGS
jgi:hypothetical protein